MRRRSPGALPVVKVLAGLIEQRQHEGMKVATLTEGCQARARLERRWVLLAYTGP